MKKILITILALGTIAQAGFMSDWFGDSTNKRIDKTPTGYKLNHTKVKTQYESTITWGADWDNHVEGNPVFGVAVMVYGTNWSYTTVTDDNGYFIVPVRAGSTFKLKASNGDTWIEYSGTIPAVTKGTTGK